MHEGVYENTEEPDGCGARGLPLLTIGREGTRPVSVRVFLCPDVPRRCALGRSLQLGAEVAGGYTLRDIGLSRRSWCERVGFWFLVSVVFGCVSERACPVCACPCGVKIWGTPHTVTDTARARIQQVLLSMSMSM